MCCFILKKSKESRNYCPEIFFEHESGLLGGRSHGVKVLAVNHLTDCPNNFEEELLVTDILGLILLLVSVAAGLGKLENRVNDIDFFLDLLNVHMFTPTFFN